MGLFERLLARQIVDAVSPTARKSRREAEVVATAMGYGGMSERERYRDAVRSEALQRIEGAKREVQWTDTIVAAVKSQPGEWSKSTLLQAKFQMGEWPCAQRGIIERLIGEGRLRVEGEEGRLWSTE